MASFIASILNKSEKETGRIIAKLEALSGHPSEDVRLLAEIKAVLRVKTENLGLDPDNTTGAELHHSLLLRMEKDNDRFSRAIGTNLSATPDKFNQILVNLSEHLLSSNEVLALKKSAAKELIRQHPPTNLMKKLNCRSVESMLKRENITEIFAASAFTESGRWLNHFWSSHAKLERSDFEIRKVELVVMPAQRWTGNTPRTGLLSCLFQLGAVAVWPATGKTRTSLSLAFLLFEAIEIMRIYSASLRAQQFSSTFGKVLLSDMQANLHSPVVLENLPLPWSVFHRHYGRRGATLPATLQDYLEPDTLHTDNPHAVLALLNPTFGWWVDARHVASLGDGHPVSLNLGDLVLGKLSNPSYDARINYNFGHSFLEELLSRYLKYPGVESHLLSRLDTSGVNVDAGSINIFNKYDRNFAGKMELA